MTCSRCRVKMKEERRTVHKMRKWRCPRCGRVRMQTRRRGERGERERSP